MTTQKTPKLIFTAGLPAAGKSTTIKRTEFKGLPVVDPDEIKKSHPDYDPKDPQTTHAWSKMEARKLQLSYLSRQEDFIVDGTGTNVEKYVRWFQEAREMGYQIVVIYVKVSVQTSLTRNSLRERNVANKVIMEKAGIIDSCMSILGSIADEYLIIDNN